MLLIACLAGGCASGSKAALQADESQVKLRSMQSRVFDTTDKEKTLRTIISTLQDLDFVVEKADMTLGIVTGTKFQDTQVVKMTVTIRPRGETQMIVRANAQYGLKAIETPLPYQDFFAALEKAMFLTAQQVD
jgi:hypothetical protein